MFCFFFSWNLWANKQSCCTVHLGLFDAVYSSRIDGSRGVFFHHSHKCCRIFQRFQKHLSYTCELRYCDWYAAQNYCTCIKLLKMKMCWPSSHYFPKSIVLIWSLFVCLADKFNQNIRTSLYSKVKGSVLHFCIDHFAGKVPVFEQCFTHSAFILFIHPKQHQKLI